MIGCVLLIMLASMVPLLGVLILVPLSELFCVALAGMFFLLALVWLQERAWRRVLSTMMFPLLTLLAWLNEGAVNGIIRYGGDLIQFWVAGIFT